MKYIKRALMVHIERNNDKNVSVCGITFPEDDKTIKLDEPPVMDNRKCQRCFRPDEIRRDS